MKHLIVLFLLNLSFFLSCIPHISAQTEFGVRLLFFQNDLSNQSGTDVGQGPHAGEWQAGASVRKYFSPRFAGRLETNLTWGRYRLSGQGSNYWLEGKRFAYLSLCAMPEWRVSQTVFIGSGGFVNKSISDPYDTQRNIETGVLANLALRYKFVEVQCRFQKWLNPATKFTLGAGIDIFFGKKKAVQREGTK